MSKSNYTEIAYMIHDLVDDLKTAKDRPVENQNQEYIDRLTRTIANLEKLKAYY